MDWRFKHFTGAQTYRHLPDEALAAARGFVAEILGWNVADTADGFTARGVSFGHAAIATFHVDPAADGARVSVELAVERAGYMGFMLLDVGGYYNGQIARWLEGIGDRLEGRVGAAAPHRPPSAGQRALAWMISIAVVGFSIWAIWSLVLAPLIGIVTGVLYLPGRGGDLTLHGVWARGVSIAIFALDAFLVIRFRHWLRHDTQATPGRD